MLVEADVPLAQGLAHVVQEADQEVLAQQRPWPVLELAAAGEEGEGLAKLAGGACVDQVDELLLEAAVADHPLSHPVLRQGLEADIGVVEVLPVASTHPDELSDMLAHAVLEVRLAHEDLGS
eukprot:14493072-Heterocapsa_arctica.AAC.1